MDQPAQQQGEETYRGSAHGWAGKAAEITGPVSGVGRAEV
jgi:hypothetical protein